MSQQGDYNKKENGSRLTLSTVYIKQFIIDLLIYLNIVFFKVNQIVKYVGTCKIKQLDGTQRVR